MQKDLAVSFEILIFFFSFVKLATFLQKKLFWGQFIRLLIEGYIDITISCLVNV